MKFLESSFVTVNNKKFQIDKYSKDDKLYCFYNNTPVHVNGAIGEELAGVYIAEVEECRCERR